MNILKYHSFYLVGIKGVAMTALAQCLLDAGKAVTGCDVASDFVTQGVLQQRGLQDISSFSDPFPQETDCVIYTAAHQG
ncbi:MAG: Mur ligase domain-containing protein, partial [bacterium]|nr:Mur ligase domain-containing protein [bacterium]